MKPSLTSSKFPVSGRQEIVLCPLRISALIFVLCAIITAGCVSGMLRGKTASQIDPKPTPNPGLLKPTIAEESEKDQVKSSPVRKEAESKESVSTEDGFRKEQNGTTKSSAKDSSTNARSDGDPSAKGFSPPADSASQVARASNPARRQLGRGSDSTTASTSESVDLPKPIDPDEPIKRHDHSKYKELIKNKAVELVKEQADSDHAVMCKDNLTDEWSLVLYYPKERSYIYATYLWDEIDEQWRRAFVSDKLPLSNWQTHLRHESSGKECTTLKRARR